MQLQMVRPALAITEGGSNVTERPSHIDSWLWSRLDFTIATRTTLFVDRPPSINIDGRIGLEIEGDVRDGAAVNAAGIINLLCSADASCTWDAADQFAVRPGQHFRIVVLPFEGSPLVIEVSADAQAWDRVGQSLQSLLQSLAFPR
jgi:hypothetical protein